jgi:hypothetical protein
MQILRRNSFGWVSSPCGHKKMSLNISLPSAAITELESYRWYNAAGASLKDIVTSISFDLSTWTDVSDYVTQIGIKASVNNFSGDPGANSATVQFNNNDRRFSDLYITGPYYSNLLPGRPVKIELTVSGSTVTIFSGKVSQAGFNEYRQGTDGVAQITVLDGSDALTKKKFDKDYYYSGMKLVGTDETNSLLHILLMSHGGLSAAEVITNGEVSIICPYTVFKEGESIQYRLQELARGCQVQYCGFRHDGKFIMESRLKTAWSVPSSEYELTASGFEININKTLNPLIGNRVKVRGVKMEVYSSDCVLWELRSVKEVGKNRVFPGYCWETVATGDFFLSDPGATPPTEYWAQYKIDSGDIIHVSSLALSQTIYEGSAFNLKTTGSDLEAESKRGKLVLQNSMVQSVNVMNLQIKGTAVIERRLNNRNESDIKQLKLDLGLSDDDLQWGLVAVDSAPSSIVAYGQIDLVVSSEYIIDPSQMIAILDWNLKYGKEPKHSFGIDNLPFLAFVQPGAVITLGLSDLGYSSLVEVSDFQHTITPNGAKTSLTVWETPQSWVISCAVAIREIIAAPSGGVGQGEGNAAMRGEEHVYSIGALGASGPYDAFCDGIQDDIEINYGVQKMVARGGGTIFLMGGQFNLSGPISLFTNIELNIDSVSSIVRDGDFHALQAFGTSVTHLSSITLTGPGKVTRNGDTSEQGMIYFEYIDRLRVSRVVESVPIYKGIDLYGCEDYVIEDCAIYDVLPGPSTAWAVYIFAENSDGEAIGNILNGHSTMNSSTAFAMGVYTAGSGSNKIQRNTVRGIRPNLGGTAYGIYSGIDDNDISDNTIESIAEGSGIFVAANIDKNLMQRNRIANCEFGIRVGSNGDSNRVFDNIIHDCDYYGVYNEGYLTHARGNICYDNYLLIPDMGGGEPYIVGDGYSIINCTLSMSSTISSMYDNVFLTKFTRTASTGTCAYHWMCDSQVTTDMHIMSKKQGSYRLSTRIWIPSGGMTGSEVGLLFSQYYGAAWHDTFQGCAASYDQWQSIYVSITMYSTVTGIRLALMSKSTASAAETFYFEHTLLRALGNANEHINNFHDSGIDTIMG